MRKQSVQDKFFAYSENETDEVLNVFGRLCESDAEVFVDVHRVV